MTVKKAMQLLNLRKKRELAPILGQKISRIDTLNPNAELSKGSTIIVEQQKEIIDLEAILQSLGYGVARKCDNCGDVFDTIRVREDGDVVCKKCSEAFSEARGKHRDIDNIFNLLQDIYRAMEEENTIKNCYLAQIVELNKYLKDIST